MMHRRVDGIIPYQMLVLYGEIQMYMEMYETKRDLDRDCRLYSVHTLPKVEMAGGRDPLKPSGLVRDGKWHVAFLCAAEL